MSEKTILVIGTYDTKDEELGFLSGVIRDQGGKVITMDVSVLGRSWGHCWDVGRWTHPSAFSALPPLPTQA